MREFAVMFVCIFACVWLFHNWSFYCRWPWNKKENRRGNFDENDIFTSKSKSKRFSMVYICSIEFWQLLVSLLYLDTWKDASLQSSKMFWKLRSFKVSNIQLAEASSNAPSSLLIKQFFSLSDILSSGFSSIISWKIRWRKIDSCKESARNCLCKMWNLESYWKECFIAILSVPL